MEWITKLFFSVCIPIKLTNTVIYPCYKTSNFSANIAFRRRRFSKNHINFIFLTQEIKQNNQQLIFKYSQSSLKIFTYSSPEFLNTFPKISSN